MTISPGQSTTLSFAVSTSSGGSAQWYTGRANDDPSPISGQTGSVINVAPTSTTSYWARFQNACGSYDSDTATVTIGTQSSSFAATPNPANVCDGTGLTSTSLSWSFPAASVVEIHLGSPSGPLFARGGSTGTAQTGKWVSDGMLFVAQNVTGGLPLTSANTLGSVTVRVSCSGSSFTATPAQGNVCDGSGLAAMNLQWNFSSAQIVELHLGAPNGPLFAAADPADPLRPESGSATQFTFYAQNVTGGLPLTAANTLGTLRATVGCFQATPNPIRVCDGSGLGATSWKIWNHPSAQIVEIHLGSPSGPLFARGGSAGLLQPGNGSGMECHSLHRCLWRIAARRCEYAGLRGAGGRLQRLSVR